MQDIEGVYVANVTPFRDDESLAVNDEAYLEHVSWLAAMGVRGIVPFGTNGEGPSVTLGEKLRVLEVLFGRGFPLQIIIVYHIPKYAVPVPDRVVKELPVWGVKDSGGEEGYAEAVLQGGEGVLLGTEDNLWQRLGTGAQGVISALANFMPEEVLELYEKHGEGDEAEGTILSEKLQKARAMTKEYASPAVLKKLAEARHGARMGTVRPPFAPVPPNYDPTPALRLVSQEAGR